MGLRSDGLHAARAAAVRRASDAGAADRPRRSGASRESRGGKIPGTLVFKLDGRRRGGKRRSCASPSTRRCSEPQARGEGRRPDAGWDTVEAKYTVTVKKQPKDDTCGTKLVAAVQCEVRRRTCRSSSPSRRSRSSFRAPTPPTPTCRRTGKYMARSRGSFPGDDGTCADENIEIVNRPPEEKWLGILTASVRGGSGVNGARTRFRRAAATTPSRHSACPRERYRTRRLAMCPRAVCCR